MSIGAVRHVRSRHRRQVLNSRTSQRYNVSRCSWKLGNRRIGGERMKTCQLMFWPAELAVRNSGGVVSLSIHIN